MRCLHCQKDIILHTKEEAIDCTKWLQSKYTELANNYNELWKESIK